jgi:protein-S-isoprenylcysteine O-methyltransferase Ste14
MIERLPALFAAICLSAYWFWVVLKLIRVGDQLRRNAAVAARATKPGSPVLSSKSKANAGNAIPREPVGQIMRLLWYPCIFVLLTAVWLAAVVPYARIDHWVQRYPRLGIVGWIWRAQTLGFWWWPLVIAATASCFVCTILTFVCWQRMGRSWRIGIDPGETLELVSTGPYRWVRHPIYALRMVINLCVWLMAPTFLVLLTAGIDCILLQIEARREERYMESKHGDQYARYKNSVGRFVPRAFVV